MLAIVAFLSILSIAMIPDVYAFGLLHFKPDKDATVASNHFLSINGTSAPSNSTHINCTVSFQTNGHGYKPVKPDVNGSYVKWNTITDEMMKSGTNVLEGQILCFAPSSTAPNLIHHLVHNVTAVP